MLFFGKRAKPEQKAAAGRPKTIQEIKRLKNFVNSQRNEPGKSLTGTIKQFAQRDESFNEFLRNFKAKNEQNWASVVDLTQEEQEEQLLAKSPEYRRNEMLMLEEFRRRRNLKDYYDLMKKRDLEEADALGRDPNWHDMDKDSLQRTQ